MKKSRMKKGIVILNKINGKKYVVEEVYNEKAYAKETTGQDAAGNQILGEENITLTPEMLYCFRIIWDPNPTPDVEEYSLAGGILLKNGVTVTRQGNISVERIIGAVPKHLVLLAKKEGKAESIILYNPVTDEFKHIYTNSDELELVNVAPTAGTEGFWCFIFVKPTPEVTETEVTETEEEEEKPLTELVVVSMKSGENKIFDIEDEILEATAGTSDAIALRSEDFGYILTENEYRRFESPILSLVRNWGISGYTAKTKNEIYLLDKDLYNKFHFSLTNKDDMDSLNGHCFLVDFVKKQDNQITIVFGSPNYTLKKCVVEHTKDRGDLVTVTDFISCE